MRCSYPEYGRLAITLSPTQYKTRDFATPVVFMRVRDGHLFQREVTNSSLSHEANDLIIDILGNFYRRAFALNFRTRFATPDDYAKVLKSIQECHAFLQRNMVRVAAKCSFKIKNIVLDILKELEIMEVVFRKMEPYTRGEKSMKSNDYLDGRLDGTGQPELTEAFLEMEKLRIQFLINVKILAEESGIPLPELPANEQEDSHRSAIGTINLEDSSKDIQNQLNSFLEFNSRFQG